MASMLATIADTAGLVFIAEMLIITAIALALAVL